MKEKRREGQASKMGSDVISFCAGGCAVLPLAGETKVVCTFSADVYIAEMIVKRFWVREWLRALSPETDVF